MGLEPTAYALEGHCSFHLRYIPMCVSISCMPTFKALTQRNTYGYFYFRRASASYLLVRSDPTAYANFMSAMAVRDFNVFTDNPRIKTYNGIPRKPDYHKPVKPSRALRRLLTAFRYEVKGVFHVDGIFADGKDRKKKTSAKQDYQDSDLGCSSQSAVPYRLAIVLNSGRETICSRIIFVNHFIQNCHACAWYFFKQGKYLSFSTRRLHTLLMP